MNIQDIMKKRSIKVEHLCKSTGLSQEHVKVALKEDKEGTLSDKKKIILLKGICKFEYMRNELLKITLKKQGGLEPILRFNKVGRSKR